jgi:plasmid stabilization system protein ParE
MLLHISPEAQSDLQGIKEYIALELDNPTAATNTIARITRAIRSLGDFPDSGAPLESRINVRTDYRYLVSGNYLVFYRHEGDDVYVIRVLYGRRDYMKILFGDPHEEEN